MKAIEDAYKPYMMQRKYPFVCLQYNISGEEVDVVCTPQRWRYVFRTNRQFIRAT